MKFFLELIYFTSGFRSLHKNIECLFASDEIGNIIRLQYQKYGFYFYYSVFHLKITMSGNREEKRMTQRELFQK
jgi:hypothetical protein